MSRTREENREYMRQYRGITKSELLTNNLVKLLYGHISIDNEYSNHIVANLLDCDLHSPEYSIILKKSFANGDYTLEQLYNSIKYGWSNMCFTINNTTIAPYLNTTRPTLIKKLNELEQAGYIRCIGKEPTDDTYKYVNIYQINKVKIENDYDISNATDYAIKYFGTLTLNAAITNNKVKRKIDKISNFTKVFPWSTKDYRDVNNNFLREEDGKISCGRYYTSLCGTKNPYNYNDRPLDRYYELDKLYGLDNLNTIEEYEDRYDEYDISAMSIRTTKNFVNLIQGLPFVDIDIDIYEEIFKEFNLHIEDFHNSEQRKVLKVELQSIFQNLKCIKYKATLYKEYQEKLKYIDNITTKTFDIIQRADKVKRLFKCEYNIFLYKVKKALYEYLKYKDVKEEIVSNSQTKVTLNSLLLSRDYYIIEGCILGEMHHYFKNKGIEVHFVYDSIYLLKGQITEQDFYNAYNQAVKIVFEKLSKEQILKRYIKQLSYNEFKNKTKKKLFIDKAIKIPDSKNFGGVVSLTYTPEELAHIKAKAKVEHF